LAAAPGEELSRRRNYERTGIMPAQNATVDEIEREQIDGCEFHEAGLQLVVALFARLRALEQRVETLEARDRVRHRRPAA
jgi:hypothetical protein